MLGAACTCFGYSKYKLKQEWARGVEKRKKAKGLVEASNRTQRPVEKGPGGHSSGGDCTADGRGLVDVTANK